MKIFLERRNLLIKKKLLILICLLFIFTNSILTMYSNTGIKVYDDGYNDLKSKEKIEKSITSSSIEFSNLFGGNKTDSFNAVVVDSKENIIVTGSTQSLDFPTMNAYDSTYNDGSDAIVTKFSSNGNLLWSTYLGGNGDDSGQSITVDRHDNIFVVGHTSSDNFPLLNAYDNTFIGSYEAFITKFSSNGSLLWSTFLGGIGSDYSKAVAIDSSDNIIVTGVTSSDDFPTLNAYDNTFNGDYDAFVSKFSSNGSLLWSTYLGGSEVDNGDSIVIDSSDNIILTGSTTSPDFPILNPYDNTYNDLCDAIVTKFSSNGTLLWSTFLGGNAFESIEAITVDGSDDFFITGSTKSIDFPTLNAYNNSFGGIRDSFIAKFQNDGSLLWSTFLGGSDNDRGKAVSIDSHNNTIVTGETKSTDFPILNAYDDTFNGKTDCFIVTFSSDGTLLYSSYLGGTDDDYNNGSAIDKEGNVIILGITSSDDFPTTSKEFLSNSSYYACFLTKITLEISSITTSIDTTTVNSITPSFDFWNLLISISVISLIYSYRMNRKDN